MVKTMKQHSNMSKISRGQINQLKEMIVAHINSNVYRGFDKYLELWVDFDGVYQDNFDKYLRMSEIYSGYSYRGSVNIREIYLDLGLNKVMTTKEFVSMFDILWINCALSIIKEELNERANEELAY